MLELLTITKEMHEGYEQAWIGLYRTADDFLYRVMPVWGKGMISKN